MIGGQNVGVPGKHPQVHLPADDPVLEQSAGQAAWLPHPFQEQDERVTSDCFKSQTFQSMT